MDPNDPVMKAMMVKCGGADVHAGMDHSKAAGTPSKPDAHGGH
jgi:hypothetical protein